MHEVWSFKSPSNPDRRCMAFRTWSEYITNITTDVLYRWTWLQKPQRGGDVDPASQWRRARIFRQSLKAPQSIRRATSQEVLMVKNPPASAGEARDTGSAPGLGGSSEVGCGNPLQYACLENSRGAWQTTIHGTPKIWTRLSTSVSAAGRKTLS